MISSPSPTQQPPDPDVKPAERQVKSASTRQRPGQTPTAKFFKTILRPIFKGIYYLLRGIRTHKLVTLGIVVLLLISVFATSYFSTGLLPFGIGNDQFNFHVNGKNGGGDLVKNWLYALRDGNVTQLSLLQKDISQPQDPTQLVSQFSQAKAHLTSTGPGGNTSGIVIFHFVTLSSQGTFLLKADPIAFRAPLR